MLISTTKYNHILLSKRTIEYATTVRTIDYIIITNYVCVSSYHISLLKLVSFEEQ